MPSTPSRIVEEGQAAAACTSTYVGCYISPTTPPTDSEYSEAFTIKSPNLWNETKSSFEAHLQTPPTSPITAKEIKNTVAKDQESPLLWKSRVFSSIKAVADVVTEELANDVDDFKPQKIIRNLTDQLIRISEAHERNCHGSFSIQPVIDFSGKATLKTAKRDSSKLVSPLESTPPERMSARQQSLPAQHISQPNEGQVKITLVPSNSKPISYKSTKPKKGDLSTILDQILPSELHQRLFEASGTCVASKVKGDRGRCSMKVGSALMHIHALPKTPNDAELTRFLEQVKKVVDEKRCSRYHKPSTLASARAAVMKLELLLERFSGLPSQDRLTFHTWADAVSGVWKSRNGDLGLSAFRAANPDQTTMSKSSGKAVSSTPIDAKSHLQLTPIGLLKFQHYQPNWSKQLSVQDALLEVVTDDLTPSDLKPGFIYIFWYKGQFEYVKIGRSKDPYARLEQWNKQCGREHEFHISSNRGDLQEVAHVSRIERLIHIELKELRRSMQCEGCGRCHREWFEVTESLAVKIFNKWCDWIAQEPYRMNIHTGKWELKDLSRGTLDKVCLPVALSEMPKSKPKVKRQVKPVINRHGYDLRPRNSPGKV